MTKKTKQTEALQGENIQPEIKTAEPETTTETTPTASTAVPQAPKEDDCSDLAKKGNIFTNIAALTVVICIAVLARQNHNLSTRLTALEGSMTTLENNISKNVDSNRRIFVFNMDETVKNIGLQETNQKFEADINSLDAQVKEAQATLKDLKDEKMRNKILNLSVKPLQMKRDDLLKSYTQSMQDTLGQINEALAEIATENNMPVIFISKSIAVNTNYVIDVTAQVVEKIKAKQKK